MRTLIGILIFANLAFGAWALFIDRPVEPPRARDISKLPRLYLASEAMPGEAPATAANAANGTATTALPVHCETVGPFGDIAAAATAAAVLQARGLVPAQRAEPGPDLVAYWVYLDNVPNDAAAAQLLSKLHEGGVTDARIMPAASADLRRISVGLFNEHQGADRRSRLVKSLGLTPVVTEQHQSQATYWVDLNLTPAQTLSTEGLLPAKANGAHLEIRDCPAPAGSAPAAPVASAPAAAGAPAQ
jgi:hypothetical protein